MSLFSSSSSDRAPKASRRKKKQRPFLLESLENRALPSVATISGYAYQDANSSGLYDPNETPFANSVIELTNSKGVVVGHTTTDANGYYQFQFDSTASPAAKTEVKTVTFPATQTDFNQQGFLDQFDPSLGQLTSISINHAGSITSQIQVENVSTSSGATISGTVSGQLTLTAPGVTDTLNMSQYAGTVTAGTYDGTTDFQGTSGTSFGVKTANGTDDKTVTGADLTSYIGTGKVQVVEAGTATSSANAGGNLVAQISSSGQATVTVTYHYVTTNALKPDTYIIHQITQPAGYLPGKLSSGGQVLGTPVTDREITVVFDAANDSLNNNFAEIKPGSISGFVYHDPNNDGQFQASEQAIANVTITLTGTDTANNAVNKSTTTAADGSYQFLNLAPGSYTVKETQPASWLDGQTTAGSLSGTVTDNQIASIALPQNGQSINNNFGELKTASLSGHVYFDQNASGSRDANDPAIANVTISLTGIDYVGNNVTLSTTTAADGTYQFANLAPGTYTVHETQPATWLDGTTTAGTLNGTVTNNQIASIVLPDSGASLNNDFGELKTSSLSGHVYFDQNASGTKDSSDTPITNVTISLSGSDFNGNSVTQTTTTGPDGSYQFLNLAPGTYKITESQPAGYTEGTDNLGTLNGAASVQNVFSNIQLTSGNAGQNYDFGELQPSSIAGRVYYDASNLGQYASSDPAIANVAVTLSGIDVHGNSVSLTQFTKPDGTYSFDNLLPGTYTVSEAQPTGYLQGTNTIGTQSGTINGDAINSIMLQMGNHGINYNFGELLPTNADVGIVKAVSATVTTPGSLLTYTLTVTNNGVAVAQNVTVTDSLPNGETVTGYTDPGWTQNLQGNTFQFFRSSMAVGETDTITITVKVGTGVTTLVNTSVVTATSPDNNPNNNTSTVTTIVNPPIVTPPPVQQQAIPPLQVNLINFPVFSKNQLMNDGGGQYVDPVMIKDLAFVDGVYQTLTGSAGSAIAEQTAMAALMDGSMSKQTFVANVWYSPAHLNQEATQLYQSVLNRAPTASELASTVQSLQVGTPILNLKAQLLTSSEFQSLYPNSQSLSQALFQSIYNTTPTASDLQLTTQSLNTQSLGSTVQSMLFSTQALSQSVNSISQATLRRTATAGEMQLYATQLQSGSLSLESLSMKYLASSEFYQLAYNSLQ